MSDTEDTGTDTDYSWLIPTWLQDTPLGDVWEAAYIETGSGDAAIAAVRQDGAYEQYFPGNRYDDGTGQVRYSETEYLATIDSYRDSIESIGLNSDLFRDKFVQLIKGDVSGPEFWQERVKPIYDRVMNNTDAVRAEYAAAYGIDLTDEAILASVLDPEGIGNAVLEKSISMSELRGEYRDRWSDIQDLDNEYFTSLYKFGVDQNMARTLFANAETMLPVLSTLAARHADPDDTFDLNEFTAASVYSDPAQVSRMRRLLNQERSTFRAASSQVDLVRNRITGATGLEER